jgi:hypothetical protein
MSVTDEKKETCSRCGKKLIIGAFHRCPSAVKAVLIQVQKTDLTRAVVDLESGLEYTRELLAKFDVVQGRTTLSNQRRAEAMEKDIESMELSVAALRSGL